MTTSMAQPTLQTPRLILRPFELADAAEAQRLAGDKAIADTTLNVPHPYEDGMAEAWIATHAPAWKDGTAATFAVVDGGDGRLIGAIGLRIDSRFDVGELGYWIGKPFWNQGYATEAASAIARFGFDELALNRIQAKHLARNPASGRVMQKLGMRLEGTAREATKKWSRYEDLVTYAILRAEFPREAPESPRLRP